MRARATTGTPASETAVQRWFRQPEGDRNRDDLFLHLTRLDNWYDLYKSMEIVRRMTGQTKLNAMLGGDRKRWNDIWQTANCNRHAPDPVKYPLPVLTPAFDGAREFVLQHIAKVLEKTN